MQTHLDSLLSFSPSLFEILSLIEINDVSNCKSVNHRLYDVIDRNHHRMSREHINIRISKVPPVKTDTCEYVSVEISHPAHETKAEFIIDNFSILLQKSTAPAIYQLYKEWTKIGGRLNCIIESIEEGLQLILQPILRRFNVKKLSIFHLAPLDDPVPLLWFTTINKLLKSNRTECPVVRLPLRRDLRAILSSTCQALLGHSQLEPSFCATLSSTSMQFNTSAELKSIVNDFIKGWQTGDYRQPRLSIRWDYVASRRDERRHRNMQKFLRTFKSIFANEMLNSGRNELTSFIQRPSDALLLCIVYGKGGLKMFDVIGKEDIKPADDYLFFFKICYNNRL